ncbi:hypothetical protein C0J52_18572 [Blattella germanica]|nr:hypothetical protein C0J52_18572 [Blattella germanica]
MVLRMKKFTDIFPRAWPEIAAFFFVMFIIPVVYWFELYVVLPSYYPIWSFWYVIHFISGTFVMCNITSNFVAVVCTDTSIKGIMLPSTLAPNWHFCSVCETTSPPRSWHCETCNTCIMRRDHHCMFTGCCIGHFNYRFFLVFIIHMLLGTIYATYFNSWFIWENVDFRTPMAIVKLIFPLAMVAFGIDLSVNQMYLILYLIILMAMFFMVALLIIHVNLIYNGNTTYEKNHKITDYNLGWKQNFKDVLGENWIMTLFLPFAESKLPGNGINWNTKTTWPLEGEKTR